jgi:hypothetical protein
MPYGGFKYSSHNYAICVKYRYIAQYPTIKILKSICTFVNIWNIINLVAINCVSEGIKMEGEEETRQYYVEIITNRVSKCNDIELLDLIAIMLEKSKEGV